MGNSRNLEDQTPLSIFIVLQIFMEFPIVSVYLIITFVSYNEVNEVFSFSKISRLYTLSTSGVECIGSKLNLCVS